VIETVENRTHVIIIQSILDNDVYQDVATIDVEKTETIKHVQVVGDVLCTVKIIFTNLYITVLL
jgi:hypothetical protein